MSSPDGAELDGDADAVECALVEYVLGNVQTRKWTLGLGQTYKIGRKDTGADIEIDHESISRRHCSLALTRLEEDLVLVILDAGSSNGTFVDKRRLEKGVGLTKKVAEMRFMSFGHCENGYRVLVRGDQTNEKGKAFSGHKASSSTGKSSVQAAKQPVNKRGGPLDADQKAQIERLKRIAGPDDEFDAAQAAASKRREGRDKAETHDGSTPAGSKDSAATSGNRREGRETETMDCALPSGNRRERREAARREAEGQRPIEVGASPPRSRSPLGKSREVMQVLKEDSQDEWQQKADKAKQMTADVKRRQAERIEEAKRRAAGSTSGRPESVKKDASKKTSWRADPEAYRLRKAAEATKNGPAKGDAADIEWPEDWK